MKILSLPVPVLAAAAELQLPDGVAEGIPGWLALILLGIWVTLWFLDRVGKLPGRPNGERRSYAFGPEDRDRLEKVYSLLAHRDDQDGIERFLRFLQESRDSHAKLREAVDLLRITGAHLERIARQLESGR